MRHEWSADHFLPRKLLTTIKYGADLLQCADFTAPNAMHNPSNSGRQRRRSLRGLRLYELLSPLRVIVFAAILLELPDLIQLWLFSEKGIPWVPLCFACVYYMLAGGLVWGTIRWFDPVLERRRLRSLLPRIAPGVLVVAMGSAVACGVLYLLAYPLLTRKMPNATELCLCWYHATAVAVLVYIWLVFGRMSRTQAATILNAQLETDLMATGLANAELAMLEAQIEPHFLFNTLAHVQRQYRHDAGAANHMLSDLIEYLDRALPALQRPDWTVGDELALIRLYLKILAQRFSNRLRYEIAAPDRCKHLSLPALTIATLVENAVRHGITPKPEGGTVGVTVNADSARLRIEVSDDGAGLRQTQGTGLGLVTVRARLKSTFGDRAVLALQAQASGGVLATIQINAAT